MPPKKKQQKDLAQYEHQKALARERQRRRRAKFTEEQLETKRAKERERYEKLKKEKTIKPVSELTQREHRKIKKVWRESKRKIRAEKKAKSQDNADHEIIINTPPTEQKRRGRKQVRKERSKANRMIKKQDKMILTLQRQVEKYKKRALRKRKETLTSPSPSKKVATLIGKEKVSPNIRKQLFLGCVLEKQLKDQAKDVGRKNKEQQLLCKAVGNKILKKYRTQKYFTKIVPYTLNKKLETEKFSYSRKTRLCISLQVKDTLTNYFEDDSVSKICPGKKDFVTKGKIKKQRRILLDTLENLHKRFVEETKNKMSLSSFSRSKPFWVTHPKKTDRDTCACIKHSNMELMFSSLKRMQVISERNLSEAVSSVVCSKKSEECMLSRCVKCKDLELKFIYDDDFQIKYYQWKNVKEEITINKKTKVIKKTVKSNEVTHISAMIQHFKNSMTDFKKHVFYAVHQQNELKKKIDSLEEGELLFRMDFSENYVCKYAEEVQSVHFGASKKQLSLNTGVRYALIGGNIVTQCFASVSENLDHQAHAVWAHMHPFLERSAAEFPDTRTVHFFSDSPSSQYRNRINMYLFKYKVPTFFKKLESMTWNFTEAGHGKGPMDGVGGTLKRGADQKVGHGMDITSASEFVAAMKGSTILLVEIDSEAIQRLKTEVGSLLIPPIKGVMKVHQIVYSSGVMYSRSLSCFTCPTSQNCYHYTLNEVFPGDLELEKPIVPSKPMKKKSILSVNNYSSSEDELEELILPVKRRKKKSILSVDDIFSSSEDETNISGTIHTSTFEDEPLSLHLLPEEVLLDKGEIPDPGPSKSADEVSVAGIKLGVYVLVKFEVNKSKCRQFVGVCQSGVVDNEFDVMFLKNCSKDSKIFLVDENDNSLVNVNQVVSVLPSPKLLLKGNRIYYKFKHPVLVF